MISRPFQVLFPRKYLFCPFLDIKNTNSLLNIFFLFRVCVPVFFFLFNISIFKYYCFYTENYFEDRV